MKRIALALMLVFALSTPAYAHDHDGNGNPGSCQSGGCDNDQSGDSGDRCYSPCSITIIVPPMGGGTKPQGFIPPNPGKIPAQIQAFLKLTFDFVQGVLSFAVSD